MGKTVKKIWNLITSLMVVAAVLLAIALVGVRLLGYQVFTVLSGSMEPEYHVGSLIYVKEVDYTHLKPGDVITYLIGDNTVATHRITEVLIDENDPTVRRFFTKGDANEQPDAVSVHYKNIIGSPVFTIPYLGYVANYIQNPPGTYVTIAAVAVLVLLMFVPDIFADNGKDKKKESKDSTAEPPKPLADENDASAAEENAESPHPKASP